MRASAALLVACAALLCCGVAAYTAPNTPPDDSGVGEAACLLDGLGFSDATIKLSPQFNPGHFHYTYDCTTCDPSHSFVVRPHMFEVGSSAEISWNGARVNYRDANMGISNMQDSPGSPRKESVPLMYQAGTNTIVVGVGCNGLGQPTPCYYQYQITCNRGTGGGYVTGDPQFVGLRGQSFQVHGVAGEVYNIVSDADLQYNSKFVFLDAGECPVVNGKKQKACWSHPGSYLGELGLKTRAGDRIRLTTGSAKQGYASVTLNGRELKVGQIILLKGDLGSVSRNSTHLASVQVGNWDFAFENSDRFVNQRVRVLDARALSSHGLLGQTWRATTYPTPVKYVQGAVDDYVIKGKDLFGDEFLYNQFGQ